MLVGAKVIAISNCELEMNRNAAKKARNINNSFGSGTANNERTVQWSFKKIRDEDAFQQCISRNYFCTNFIRNRGKAIIQGEPLKITLDVAEEQRRPFHHSRHVKRFAKVIAVLARSAPALYLLVTI